MTSNLGHAALIVGTVCCAVACGDPNNISGSIDEAYPMVFDQVKIRKQDNSLRIEYIRDVSGTSSKVLAIVVDDVERAELKRDAELSGDSFREYVTLYRVASTGGRLPPVEDGSLGTKRFKFQAGGRVKGRMEALFENGRTLEANFDGAVEEVSTE